MNTARTLALIIALAATGIAYWFFAGVNNDIAAPTAIETPSPTAATVDPTDAALGVMKEPEQQPDAQRTAAAAAASLPTNAPALVGTIKDEQGLPIAGAVVSTGITAAFSQRSFGAGDFDWQDASKMAQRMRERMAARVEVTSGSDGTFRLVPDGEGAQLQIEARARAFQLVNKFVDRPSTQDIDVGVLTLPRGAIVTGRVVDNQSQPIEGASVMRIAAQGNQQGTGGPANPGLGSARFGGGGPFGAMMGGNGMDLIPGEMLDVMRGFLGDVLTDKDGRFEMPHMPPGDFGLRARHHEHPSAAREGLSAPTGQTVADLLIIMAPGADITGRVTAIPDGMKDVRVLCAQAIDTGLPSATSATPGSAGNQAFAQMGGQFAEMLGDFALTAERSAEPMSDGSFALRGLPVGKRYRVWVTQGARGFLNNNVCSQRIEVTSGATGIELAFDPGIVVTAKVADKDTTKPVEAMIVRHQFDGGNDMMAMAQGFLNMGGQLRPYPEGNVTIPSLRPKKEQKLRVTIEAIGYRKFEQRDIQLPASGSLDLGTIALEGNPTVRVEVRDKSGLPVVGASVRLRSQQGGGGNDMNSRVQQFMNQAGGRGGRNMGPFTNMRSGGLGTQKTDENGIAILNQNVDGSFSVVVEDDGYSVYRSQELQPSDEPITHSALLLRGGSAAVAALDGEGKPIGNARIEHQDPAGDNETQNGNGEGVATFEKLAPGEHKFRIASGNQNPMQGFFGGGSRRGSGGDGSAAQQAEWTLVQVTDEARAEVTLSKAASATLSGIVSENGMPVSGARVQFVKGAADEAQAATNDPVADIMRGLGGTMGGGRGERTDGDGRYTLKELPAGSHRIRVSLDGRSMPMVAQVVLRLGQNMLDVTIDSAAIAGVVVDPDGKPVAEASVRVTLADEASINVQELMQGLPFGRGSRGMGGSAQVTTNAEGSFELKGVQPGTALVVRASKAGFAGGESASIQVAAGGSLTDLRVQLTKGGTVKVTSSSSGQPFAFVLATYDGTDAKGVQPKVAMLSDGKATIEGLRPGTWRITSRQGMGGMGAMFGNGGRGNAGNPTADSNATDPMQIVNITAGQTIEVTL